METSPLLADRSANSLEDLNYRINDVRILGAGFFFIFAAQSTIATLTSTVLPPSIAFTSSGILYISFALFNLLAASSILDCLGPQAGLFFASLIYTFYNCAVIAALLWTGNEFIQNAILIPTAVLSGLGAAVIWTSQGVFVAKCSTPHTLGRYNGQFFGAMWSSGLFGPIFSSTLIGLEFDKVAVFQGVTVLSLIGVILLGYLWQFRPEPSNPWNTNNSVILTADESPVFSKTAKLCLSPTMLLLTPLFYATGFEQAFYGSSLPLFIRTDFPNADISTKLYLRATLGFIITSTALVVGRMIDRFGARPLVLACCAIHLVYQSLLLFAHPFNNIPVLVAVYVCVGISNGILMNVGQKVVGTLFPQQQLSQAYSGFKFHMSVGTAVCFFFSNWGLNEIGVPEVRLWAPLFLALIGASFIGVDSATKAIQV